MKSLSTYLESIIGNNDIYLESLLDDDDKFYDPVNGKKLIEGWINENYKFTGKLTISNDFVVDCNNAVKVKNKSITSLTNGLFEWGKVGGSFSCSECKNLKSLEGAPKKVGYAFDCSQCGNLTTIKDGPEKVGIIFYCSECPKLTITDSDRKKYKIDK